MSFLTETTSQVGSTYRCTGLSINHLLIFSKELPLQEKQYRKDKFSLGTKTHNFLFSKLREVNKMVSESLFNSIIPQSKVLILSIHDSSQKMLKTDVKRNGSFVQAFGFWVKKENQIQVFKAI